MMRAVFGLLLLLLLGLCGSGARGEEGDTAQTSKQTSTNLWLEVRGLRDVVGELMMQLHTMEKMVKDRESLAEELRDELMITNMNVAQLQTENLAQAQQLAYLEMRISVTEGTTRGLQEETEYLETRLSSAESELLGNQGRIIQLEKDAEAKAAKLKSLELRLTAIEGRTNELKAENTGKTEIAFYTALADSGVVGPYDTDTNLIYSKVYTNIGRAYNPATGFFTAPVKGVYYLQFTACADADNYSAVYLYKNNYRIMLNHVLQQSRVDYYTNSVVLELNAGEEIYLVLPTGYAVFDDGNNQSTFSGFLLFQH